MIKNTNNYVRQLLYTQVGGIDKEVVLPVSKSDQRYFPLYRGSNQDPWGIVSEVRSEYGTTKINIHGVVKVCINATAAVANNYLINV